MKNTEIENTKLVSEVQTLKNLDGNKESMITHFKEEIGRLQFCLAEKENLQRTFLLTASSKVSMHAICIWRLYNLCLLNVDNAVVFIFNLPFSQPFLLKKFSSTEKVEEQNSENIYPQIFWHFYLPICMTFFTLWFIWSWLQALWYTLNILACLPHLQL